MIYFLARKSPFILGEYDNDIDFAFEAGFPVSNGPWEMYGACAASLNNEMWLIGGALPEQRRKVICVLAMKLFTDHHISDTKSHELCIGRLWRT